jgi:hypothetical protein
MFISFRRGALFVGISLVTAAGASRLYGQAVLRGILYDDATGTRLRGTVMLVDPATDAPVVHMATDTLGQFTMQFRGGTFQIAAVYPGYTSVLSAPLSFQSGERMTVRIPIAAEGDPKHQIGVLEHIRPGDERRKVGDARRSVMEGFETRRTLGTGLQYDHTQLVRSQLRTLGAFLQTVPGFRVGDPSSTSSMMISRTQALAVNGSSSRYGCRIAWFLDGHRLDIPGRNDSMTDALGSMPLEHVAGVEIFRGVSELPAEFAEPDVRCGAVAVWTLVG